ncbi:MAG TPA: hypothetical protein DCS19_08905, partial [Flavobacterium sp.]|nr:hypothetical protein [Flavobacterium sp.]
FRFNLKSKILNLKWNGKVNNKTQARRPAYYIEYQTFGKKGLGMGHSMPACRQTGFSPIFIIKNVLLK